MILSQEGFWVQQAIEKDRLKQEKDTLNREICEKLRICWHEPKSGYDRLIKNDKMECVKCGGWFKVHPLDLRFIDNPDYTSDPGKIQLLREMQKREDFPLFMARLMYMGDNIEAIDWDNNIDVDLILDITGKLAKEAIEFMRKEGT